MTPHPSLYPTPNPESEEIAIASVKNAGPEAWLIRDNREVKIPHIRVHSADTSFFIRGSDQELSRRTRASVTRSLLPSGKGDGGEPLT